MKTTLGDSKYIYRSLYTIFKVILFSKTILRDLQDEHIVCCARLTQLICGCGLVVNGNLYQQATNKYNLAYFKKATSVVNLPISKQH